MPPRPPSVRSLPVTPQSPQPPQHQFQQQQQHTARSPQPPQHQYHNQPSKPQPRQQRQLPSSPYQGAPRSPYQNSPNSFPRRRELPTPATPATHQKQPDQQQPPTRRSQPLPSPTPRQIQPEQSIHSCAVCRQRIKSDERVVQTNGVHLHIDCFRCWHCRMQLEHSQFYFVPEKQRFYCHLDYHELFSARCNYCKTPIEGSAVFALGHHWHAGHFFCAQCSTPFKENEDYCILDNNAWCQGCYTKKTALSCWKCGHKLVNGEACIEALGRNWCNTCFACEICEEPFQSNEFILREDGVLVCLPCEAKRIRNDVWKWFLCHRYVNQPP